ncbi:MAG: S9 family peptidase [Phycisphaerales bacterium]
MTRRTPALLLASLVVTSAAWAQNNTPLTNPVGNKDASPTALISRDVLFGNPDRAQARLSPDGKQIAFLAPVNGVLNVWVAPVEQPDKAKPITSDSKRGIRQYFWAFTNSHILYLQDSGGDEDWRLYSVDLASGKQVDLTPFDSIPGPDGKPLVGPTGRALRPTAQIQGVSEKSPNELLIGLNNRDPRLHDIYRVNIKTGEMKLVRKNESMLAYICDDDFNVRFAMRFTPKAEMEIVRVKGDATEPFATIGPEDSMTTAPAGFNKTQDVLYMTDSRGRNTAALKAVDLKTGDEKILAEDPKADVGEALVHPIDKTVQAVAFDYDRQHWKILDPAVKPDLDYLAGVCDGDLGVVSRSMDDKRWIVAYTDDDGPVRYYRYDRAEAGKAGKATFLFSNRKALEGLPLSPMHAMVLKSRDGMELVSYLTLPKWADADANARPDKPLPMVLMVHGGPWARDDWGYDPYHQWLSNRGYAVLSVNYRGSTGFGKNFVNAANGEWAGKMHDDLLDAVNWAVDQKIADKSKVAIMGGSYGGYATLVGLTFTPDFFACGVDIVGPSSLQTLMQNIPEYWYPFFPVLAQRVGDPSTEEGRKLLAARSPLGLVDRIKKPLLIGQGANDPRVKQVEADQIVSAMKKASIPVTYVLFPDEGHGFARPENNAAFNAVTEAFLSQHLGGRFEPVGDAMSKSSAQVKVGAEHVPGLGSTNK